MQASAIQSWETTYTGNNRWYLRLFPCLTDLVFLLPAFLLLAILPGTKALLADGDTGWHIRTGQWILQHKAVPTVDLFSFTKPHEAWFAWEWGWDVLFAVIHNASGLAGVALANVILLCLISALLFRLIRRCSENDLLALLFTFVSLAGSSIHWLARPHLFSWLFVLIFSHVLLSAAAGKLKALWWLPFLTIAWTNIHGAFFVGVLMLLVSAAGEALGIFIGEKQIAWGIAYSKARPYLICAVGCAVASFINPYTWHLHQHIFSYLRDSKLLDEIQEYQSISFHHAAAIFFEGMLLLGVASTVWCFQRGKFGAALLVLMWAHLALWSARNIPVFVFIAAPWITCMVQDTLGALKPIPFINRLATGIRKIYADLQPMERMPRCYLVSVCGVLCMVGLLAAGNPNFEAEFDAKRFPVQAIPAIQAGTDTRIFTFDQWGDYLIYRLYPSIQVFVDGRSDFYGAEFVIRCEHLVNARYGWEAELQRYGVNTVLLKPNAPLSEVLKRSRNWRVVFDNGSAILFRATSHAEHGLGIPSQFRIEVSPAFNSGGKQFRAFLTRKLTISNLQRVTHERRSL
jgi:hypothetical protein